jgi:lambda family phage minor tail protein L
MIIPYAEAQRLSPGSRVFLYELDATKMGGEITYWTPWVNQLGEPIVFQGKVYNPYPILAEGFEKSTEGSLPRPKLRIANQDGLVGALCRQYDDLVGAVIRRRQTLEKFLDAVNFPGGINPTAGNYQFLPETWILARKTAETKESIEWELSASCDATGLTVPARKMQSLTCAWTKPNDPNGGNCPYVNICQKTMDACKTHHGTGVDLPFGAFPGLLRVRQ